MLDFIRYTRAESIKLKYSGVLWLSTLGTVFSNLMMALIPYNFPFISEYLNMDPLGSWEGWFRFHYLGILPMLLPMFLVILCALSILTENRSGSWKMLYSLPIPKSAIYLSKLQVISLVFVISHLLFMLLMILIPLLMGQHIPFGEIPIALLLNLAAGTILSCMGILGLVFLISYFSRSFVFPLAVGILGFVMAQLIADYKLGGTYFPFSWPSLTIDAIFGYQPFWPLLGLSMLFFVIITTLGVVLATRDRTKPF